MPDLTSNAATFRAGKYTYRGYLSIVPQTIIFSRAVNQASFTYPLKTITFDNPYSGAGVFGDVLEDLTVLVYSQNTSTLKGRLRVASGAASSTVLQVSEFAKGVIDLADNDRFDVVKEWRIWDRLVEAAVALRKDSRLTYTDQGSNPGPIVASGGPVAGFISGASLSANFYGAGSYVVDPDSAGTVTHAWAFSDGTPSSSTSADPVGVTFPAGFRWVYHTVTDSGNSKSTVQRIPVWAHERTGSNAPLAVQMESMSFANGGWSARFRLPKGSESDVSTLPDGALVVYHEEEFYDGAQASYGSNVANRSNIKFVGYLVRDTITIDPDTNEVAFEAVGPLGILELTPALPQLILSKTSPANWQQVKSLSVNRILWYLLHWGATADVVFDFSWVSGSDLSYARIAIDSIDSIAGQLRDVANSINVQVTCDRLGRLLMVRDPNYLGSSDRNARTTAYNLTTADLMGVDMTREHRAPFKFVRGEGITASSSTASMKPVFSNAPGNAPASYGVGSETLSKQIVSNQADLNTRTGYHFARINGLRNGVFVPRGVRVTFPDGYDVLDAAYLEWLTVTLASTTNKRGVSFSTATRWLIESLDISYDLETGGKDISAVISHETDGAAGATYTPPAANNLPAFTPPDVNFDFGTFTPSFPVTGLRQGVQTIAKFHSGNAYEITTDFETTAAAGGPSWLSTDLTALSGWPGGTLVDFTVDAFSPKYLGTGSTVNGWLCTTTHVMRITDIFGTPALTGIVALTGTTIFRKMQFERGVQNWGIVVSWVGTSGVYAAYTTNGTTWTENNINTNYDTSVSDGWIPGLWLSPLTAGKAYCNVWTSTAAFPSTTGDVYGTTDYGATWSALSSPNPDPGKGLGPIVVPYGNAGTTLYFTRSTSDADGGALLRRQVNATVADISPTSGGLTYGPVSFGRSISIADNDPNVLLLCGQNKYGGTPNFGVWMTRNAVATVPTFTELQAPATTNTYYEAYAVARDKFYMIGGAGVIAFSDGVTVDSRIGNGQTANRNVGICGN